MHPQSVKLNNAQAEADYIVDQIQSLQNSGQNLGEIAVIARKYKDLDKINLAISQSGLSINFERGQNVLDKPHVIWLITILSFVNSLNRQDTLPKDDLLPEILSYPFWEIDPGEVYQISITAYREQKTWLEIMQVSTNPQVKATNDFLLQLAIQKAVVTVETLIDYIIRGQIDQDWQEE